MLIILLETQINFVISQHKDMRQVEQSNATIEKQYM